MALSLAGCTKGVGRFEACLPQALQEAEHAVVKVTATWCGPCKAIQPEFMKACRELPALQVFSLDVDAAQKEGGHGAQLLELLDVEALPTFVAFRSGVMHGRVKGASLVDVKQMLSSLQASGGGSQ
jgi:thioredoxin 1